MKLAEYMSLHDLDDRAFADRVGVSEFAVRKWRYGERVPRGRWLAIIREVTGGEVTADDFTPELKEVA